MMTRIWICAGLLAGLAGCADPNNAVLFEGLQYGGRVQIDREDRRTFTAIVSPVSQGLQGAREAARYEGTVYCISNYGRSDIEWSRGPDAEDANLLIEGDRLTVQGRCIE